MDELLAEIQAAEAEVNALRPQWIRATSRLSAAHAAYKKATRANAAADLQMKINIAMPTAKKIKIEKKEKDDDESEEDEKAKDGAGDSESDSSSDDDSMSEIKQLDEANKGAMATTEQSDEKNKEKSDAIMETKLKIEPVEKPKECMIEHGELKEDAVTTDAKSCAPDGQAMTPSAARSSQDEPDTGDASITADDSSKIDLNPIKKKRAKIATPKGWCAACWYRHNKWRGGPAHLHVPPCKKAGEWS